MPKPGDFFLLRGTDPVGRLIEFAELLNGDGFSVYSHAGILMDTAGTVLEAEPGGARLAPYTEYTDAVVWSSWNLSDGDRARIVAAAKLYQGTPYSAADYFALVAHRLHLPVPGLKHFVADSGHMICSQLVDQTYTTAGFPMFKDDRWPGYVDPQSLSLVLKGPL